MRNGSDKNVETKIQENRSPRQSVASGFSFLIGSKKSSKAVG